jgi:diguanylate cyclase (GGDEF)-like protein
VLVSTEDITALEDARRRNAINERYAQGLFEHSPVSLWVEDFSAIKAMLDELRERGIKDLRVFTEVHPEFVARCLGEIRILDVNRHTVVLFGARDKADLLGRTDAIFRDEMRVSFRETLIDLWNDKLFQQREVVNYALDGSALYLHLQFSVLPGSESDWSRAQVALIDITARKRAEAYLEYLGQHDTLTKLKNRNFYVEELQRISRKTHAIASVIVIDVNGLKTINDVFGHAAGDDLLRRVGEVLAKAAQKPNVAARIGGDEFVVLMPGAEAGEAEAMIANIHALVGLNNQFYQGRPLSLSIGRATTRPGEHIEDAVRRADERMYVEKQAHRGACEEPGSR